MLDLDFSPEQEMLRQTTRDVLQRHCPLDVVRDMEDNPTGYPLSLWTQLGELDLIGLLLPPEHGGSGMTLVEGVALYLGECRSFVQAGIHEQIVTGEAGADEGIV